jgi:outer membrane immunogenic protein
MSKCKLIKLGLATAMLASASAVSHAVDAVRGPAYPPPPPIPLFYNCTGLYVGVHAGGGWADLGVGDTGSGFIGGGQIGYNYQINQWVWGLEAEVSGSGVKNNLATFGTPFGPITASFNWNTLWTLTPRLGYAFDNWLVYGKAGGAWADVSVSVNGPFGFGSSAGGIASGWVVGVGAEYAFRNNWSAKVEYNHFDFGSDSGIFITGNSVALDTVKAGVNYRFGGPVGPWWPF